MFLSSQVLTKPGLNADVSLLPLQAGFHRNLLHAHMGIAASFCAGSLGDRI